MSVPHSRRSKPSLPANWRWVPLKQVVGRAQYGTSESTADNFGTPVVGMGAIQNGRVHLDDLPRATLSDSELDALALKRNDLLFNRTNSLAHVGKVGLVLDEPKERTVFASYLVRLEIDPERVDARFLKEVLCAHPAVARMKSLATPGVSQLNINPTSLLRDFWLLLPPKNVQTAIARTSQTFDELANAIAKSLQNCHLRKAGLMQELLDGRRRFSGFVEPLKSVSLSELFSERVDRDNGDLELLSVTANNGIVSRDSLDRKDTSTEDKSSYKRVVPGDIAYNTMRMWQGVSALVVKEGIVSPAYTVVTPKKRISAKYATRLFKFPRVIHQFLRYSQGLVDDTLNLKFHHFSEVHVTIPEVAEQSRIVELLDLVDAEIGLLSRLRAAIEKQKRGLLERLLSGEATIPDVVVDRLNAQAKEQEKGRVKDAKLTRLANKNAS